MRVAITPDSALTLVDVQRDFCPGGALPVPQGHLVVPVLNAYTQRFHHDGRPIFASRDWHPENHGSFAAQGGPWPVHCVRGTPGALFHPDLHLPRETRVIDKGLAPDDPGYSCFAGTSLARDLRAEGVRRVFVGGLATDYCVKATVLDALKEGFQVFLLADASRGVDVRPGDSEAAVDEMVAAGAVAIGIEELESAETLRTLAL